MLNNGTAAPPISDRDTNFYRFVVSGDLERRRHIAATRRLQKRRRADR